MSQDDELYYVYWGQAKYRKSIPYDPLTNVPILYTPILSRIYCAFTTTFEAMEVPFFRRERVLPFPGRGCTVEEPELVPDDEFVAEENLNYQKDVSAIEEASADNRTVKMTNLPSPPQQEEPSNITR